MCHTSAGTGEEQKQHQWAKTRIPGYPNRNELPVHLQDLMRRPLAMFSPVLKEGLSIIGEIIRVPVHNVKFCMVIYLEMRYSVLFE
jgi:hypothetical protein